MAKKRTLLMTTLLLLALAGLSGCATKPQATIRIDPYRPDAAVLQKSGTIHLAGVVDARKEKRTVGRIVKGGKTLTVLYNDQPLAKWFADALTRALEVEGCRVVTKKSDNPKVATVRVEIDSIEATLDRGRLTSENLTAEAKVTLHIRQGNAEITKHVALVQSKWVPPLAGEDTVREYLQETLDGLVEEVRENIDIYRF
ncbi:YajG family lipoprotein [Hydrogenimonas sp.]